MDVAPIGAVMASYLPLYARQVPAGNRLRTLVRLFLLGLPVSEQNAREALAPLELRRLEEACILSTLDGAATSLTQLL